MKFMDWIADFFGVESTIYVTQKALAASETQLAIEAFAITSAINLIASSISKCEIKTYVKKVEFKGDEYYTWNVQPNINQNSSQFMQKLITKLLYENECLVLDINGQLIIADSFYQNEYAVQENSFTSVASGTLSFSKTFMMNEVMYFKLGDTDIRKLLSNLLKGYASLSSQAMGKYKLSGGEKGILKIDSAATGDKAFQTKFDELMNVRFKNYFESENAVLPLHKGYEYTKQAGDGSKKSTSEIVDIALVTKEIFERVAQAFKIPPALLRGDIADVGIITDNYLTFCIDPILDMVGEEGNRKRVGKTAYLQGNYMMIDSSNIKHIDLFSISDAFDKLIACAAYSPDELRIKCGDVALNTEWSKKHYITKNYQPVEEAAATKIII